VPIVTALREAAEGPVVPVRLTASNSFCFDCHKGVSCWNECCHDTDITLTPHGSAASLLALSGAYRPPLGALGAALDRVVLHQVAEATIQGFVNQLGEAVVQLADEPEADREFRSPPRGGPRPGNPGPPAPWTAAGTRPAEGQVLCERGAADRTRHPALGRQASAGQTPHRAPALWPLPLRSVDRGADRFNHRPRPRSGQLNFRGVTT